MPPRRTRSGSTGTGHYFPTRKPKDGRRPTAYGITVCKLAFAQSPELPGTLAVCPKGYSPPAGRLVGATHLAIPGGNTIGHAADAQALGMCQTVLQMQAQRKRSVVVVLGLDQARLTQRRTAGVDAAQWSCARTTRAAACAWLPPLVRTASCWTAGCRVGWCICSRPIQSVRSRRSSGCRRLSRVSILWQPEARVEVCAAA